MWFLAFRHLTSRKRQTLLTILGITLGSAAYCVISGMMLGFQSFIIDQLVNNDAHVRVSAREEFIDSDTLKPSLFPEGEFVSWLTPPSGRRDQSYIEHPQGWLQRLNADADVAAVSPQLSIQVVINRGKATVSGRLIGSDPNRQILVSNITKYMIKGRFQDIGQSGNRVVIGQDLLRRLGARVSESVMVATGKGAPVPFKIVGVFRLGIRSIDESTMFGAIADVQKVNNTPSRISDLAIRLVDVSEARALSETWQAMAPDKVQSWDQANEGIMSVFKTQDIVRNSMTISILIVAGFGIYNILSMAVSQRRREIAILRSMGYAPREISQLFLSQGTILGAVGGFLGIILGYLTCLYMSGIQVSAERALGTGKMLISFTPMIYVKGWFLAFGSATISALLPARAAGRLEPIEIIRREGS